MKALPNYQAEEKLAKPTGYREQPGAQAIPLVKRKPMGRRGRANKQKSSAAFSDSDTNFS